MTYRSKAYIEGDEAFDSGIVQRSNPYGGDGYEKLDWDDGWYDRSLRGPPSRQPVDTDDAEAEKWRLIGTYIAE